MKKEVKILLLFVFLFVFFISIPAYSNESICPIFAKSPKTFLGIPWKITCGHQRGFEWGPSILDLGIALKKDIDVNGYYFLYR